MKLSDKDQKQLKFLRFVLERIVRTESQSNKDLVLKLTREITKIETKG